jgi:hypothetical protein
VAASILDIHVTNEGFLQQAQNMRDVMRKNAGTMDAVNGQYIWWFSRD